MNRNIDNMKTCKIILMKIVIQSKGDFCNGAAQGAGPDGCRIPDAFQAEAGETDVRLHLESYNIIKNKRDFQRIAVNRGTDDGENEKERNDFWE